MISACNLSIRPQAMGSVPAKRLIGTRSSVRCAARDGPDFAQSAAVFFAAATLALVRLC